MLYLVLIPVRQVRRMDSRLAELQQLAGQVLSRGDRKALTDEIYRAECEIARIGEQRRHCVTNAGTAAAVAFVIGTGSARAEGAGNSEQD